MKFFQTINEFIKNSKQFHQYCESIEKENETMINDCCTSLVVCMLYIMCITCDYVNMFDYGQMLVII